MPRGRKSAATMKNNPGGQSILSFNNRVTKSGIQAQRQEQIASAKKLSDLEDTIHQHETEPEAVADVKVSDHSEEVTIDEDKDVEEGVQIVEEEPEVSKAGARRKKVKAVKGKDRRELAAEKITDAHLKKYWQAEEDSRLAPRGMWLHSLTTTLTLASPSVHHHPNPSH